MLVDKIPTAREHAQLAAERARAVAPSPEQREWLDVAMAWVEVANALAEAEARTKWRAARQAANSNADGVRPDRIS